MKKDESRRLYTICLDINQKLMDGSEALRCGGKVRSANS
jgi:hypothetical protein